MTDSYAMHPALNSESQIGAEHGKKKPGTMVQAQNRSPINNKERNSSRSVIVNGTRMAVTLDFIDDCDNVNKMYYAIEDVPSFHLVFLFGIQVIVLFLHSFSITPYPLYNTVASIQSRIRVR